MLGFKVETKAPVKISVTNGYTTGADAAFNEIYNSIYTISIETEKGLLLGNLNPVAATMGNITIDKITTGDGNVWKNISMSGIGYAIDSNISNNPFVKENLLKVS